MKKESCEKCKNGEMIEYILQQRNLDNTGYFSPRVMAKCNNCGNTIFIKKLPNVDYKIVGAVEELR